MILRRLGNKKHIAHLIYMLFPKHTIYIEPFFGAGGMFFQKPRAKYNILNDLDDDVYNLWRVIQERPQELYEEMAAMVIHESLLQYWRKNQETESIKKAVRFLMLSNFTFLGMGQTLRLQNDGINAKQYILQTINATSSILTNCIFSNKDAISFLKSIDKDDFRTAFIYCDPPYINTSNNYAAHNWTAENLEDLILTLHNTNAPFAISEYDSPATTELAAHHNLNVTYIKYRKNLKSDKKATEILLTNYAVCSQVNLF